MKKKVGRPVLTGQKIRERKILITYLFNKFQSIKQVSKNMNCGYSLIYDLVKTARFEIYWNKDSNNPVYKHRMLLISEIYREKQHLKYVQQELSLSYCQVMRFMKKFEAKYKIEWKDL